MKGLIRLFSNSNNKKVVQKVDEIDTMIGPGTKFEGNVQAQGIIRVDGTFTGEMSTQGDIIIGENGNVQGKLVAKNIVVAGTSNAKLHCSGKLVIRSSGKVLGDINVESIVIEEKGVFEGNCEMRIDDKGFKKEVVNE